jgi:energy-converting hydrogenase Eha subunit F
LSDPFCEEKLMSNIKNLVVLFAVIAAAIGLFSIFSGDSNNTEVKFSPEIPQPQQQTKSEPTVEVQPAPAGQDPFKKFLDQKPNYPSSSVRPENTQPSPIQLGKDPFKEFLDKQKQNSKDQVVSPFGKN